MMTGVSIWFKIFKVIGLQSDKLHAELSVPWSPATVVTTPLTEIREKCACQGWGIACFWLRITMTITPTILLLRSQEIKWLPASAIIRLAIVSRDLRVLGRDDIRVVPLKNTKVLNLAYHSWGITVLRWTFFLYRPYTGNLGSDGHHEY